MEEKKKAEIKDIKESIEKLKKKEKEELIEIKSQLANRDNKPLAPNPALSKDKEVCNSVSCDPRFSRLTGDRRLVRKRKTNQCCRHRQPPQHHHRYSGLLIL